MKFSGKATLEGTTRYQQRLHNNSGSKHFRQGNGIVTSSIGLGTHLGESDKQTDSLVTEAIIDSIRNGINLIDSAIIYRDGQGEYSVKQALSHIIDSKEASRDELIICTKGGILPCKTPENFNWFYKNHIELISTKIGKGDIVINEDQEYHCLHPEFIEEEIDQSLENLGLETIDIYYIHNPEIQLLKVDRQTFYQRLRSAFEVIENAVNCGKIGAYGIATWNGLRVPQSSPEHLDLAKIKSIAKEISGDREDNFRYIQFPLNMGMPEAFLAPIQEVEGEQLSLLEAAEKLGLFSIASASLYQGEVIGRIPDDIISAFEDKFTTDCQRALQYARSTPGLLTALVGMKNPKHVKENLAVNAYSPFEKQQFQEITNSIVRVLQPS